MGKKITDNIQITGERSQHSLQAKASRDLWTSQRTRNYSFVGATENAMLAPLSRHFYRLFRDVCDHDPGIMKCLSPADNKQGLLQFSPPIGISLRTLFAQSSVILYNFKIRP